MYIHYSPARVNIYVNVVWRFFGIEEVVQRKVRQKDCKK